MSQRKHILILNPGSTSTKVAIAENETLVLRDTVKHSPEELRQFEGIYSQLQFRLNSCENLLANNNREFSAVISMGGLLRTVSGGVYRVNETMLRDARSGIQGEHASNLGCALAYELAKKYNTEALLADPVSVDEFEPLAYYSGHPLIKRRSLSHSLNIHAAARRAANELAIPAESTDFVIAHLGGGISIAPVRGGRIIDVNDASGDGPFSPERTGGLPLQPFISLFFSRNYSESEIRKLVMGNGGLIAYLGTNSILDAEQRASGGDAYAHEALSAMAYQIAKEIGAMATVLYGRINAIILTGGGASSDMLTRAVEERVRFIAPVIRYPGEDEMQAMASAAFRALNGEEQVLEY